MYREVGFSSKTARGPSFPRRPSIRTGPDSRRRNYSLSKMAPAAGPREFGTSGRGDRVRITKTSHELCYVFLRNAHYMGEGFGGGQMMGRKEAVSILFVCAAFVGNAHALCLPAACYRIEARPLGCKTVRAAPGTRAFPAGEYQGVLLALEISAALREGCKTPSSLEQDWLATEQIPTRVKAFVRDPGGTCTAYLMSKQLSASVTKQCCDGDLNAPCALGTSHILTNVRATGAAW